MTEENQKPNFDFIMNQPGPEPADPSRKGRKGLFFAVIAGVGILIALGVILAFVSMKPVNVKPVNDNITQYLRYLEQGDAESAAKLVKTNPEVPAVIFKIVANTFKSTYKISECSLSTTTYKAPIFTSKVVCPYAKKTGTATLTIESTMFENQPKITKVRE